ncbi:hypothetical protein [Nocardiopsis sp. NPDC055824]
MGFSHVFGAGKGGASQEEQGGGCGDLRMRQGSDRCGGGRMASGDIVVVGVVEQFDGEFAHDPTT